VEHPDLPVSPVPTESTDSPEIAVAKENADPPLPRAPTLALCSPTNARAKLPQDLQETLDLTDPTDHPEKPEPQETTALPETKAHVVLPAPPDQTETPEPEDNPELLVLSDLHPKPQLVDPESPDAPAPPEPLDNPANPETTVAPELPDLPETTARPVFQAETEIPEPLGLKETPVPLELAITAHQLDWPQAIKLSFVWNYGFLWIFYQILSSFSSSNFTDLQS